MILYYTPTRAKCNKPKLEPRESMILKPQWLTILMDIWNNLYPEKVEK